MHVYVVAVGLPWLSAEALAKAVTATGDEFELDRATAWSLASGLGGISAAGVHHGAERCGARRYLHRAASVATFFDGLPVDATGAVCGFDAEQLFAGWEGSSGELEGAFSAVKVDLVAERLEIVTDAMALCPVYCVPSGSGVLVSNSVAVLASLLGLSEPDPLGVSSFLGLGWAASDRVLNSGVRVLAGGARHTLRDGRIRTERSFGPETIANRELLFDSTEQVADHLCRLTRNAVGGVGPVGCALTAGRDTRLLVALLTATGQSAQYFTGGSPGDPDVVIAEELADRFGLEHEAVFHDPASGERDWTKVAGRFIAQNDGLSSLLQLYDYVEPLAARPALGVKLGGIGGEIGRAGTGHLTAVATNVPLLRRSLRAQQKLLALKARNDGGLMTRAAVEELSRYLRSFCLQRLEEGWARWELQEAFYAFERVGRWAATGTRRVASIDDGFCPLATRAFIDYCFSVSPAERYIEAPHHRLLKTLAPAMLEHRFEVPFRPQHRWLAPILATGELAGLAIDRIPTPRLRGALQPDVSPAVSAEYPLQHAWVESNLDLIGDLFSDRSSGLWEFVSRESVLGVLAAGPVERAGCQEALLRAITVAWYFHGPGVNRGAESAATASADLGLASTDGALRVIAGDDDSRSVGFVTGDLNGERR
jgi:asparagine synthase (glutamine-hydrolysing)